MVIRPLGVNAYEFAVVAALRAHQLLAGCVPQVDGGHSATVTAQMEVASGKVYRVDRAQVSPSTAIGSLV